MPYTLNKVWPKIGRKHFPKISKALYTKAKNKHCLKLCNNIHYIYMYVRFAVNVHCMYEAILLDFNEVIRVSKSEVDRPV